MNERIIELYKEAAEFAYKVCKDEGRTGGPSDHIWHTLSTGRFAELIIQECISTLEEKIYRSIDGDGDEIWADLILKEHFGVEE
jgi:hypothetical protein